MIHVMVFCIMTACSVMVGYGRFGGPCCLHLHSPWRWKQHASSKRWYPTTTLHGVTTQKTWTCQCNI